MQIVYEFDTILSLVGGVTCLQRIFNDIANNNYLKFWKSVPSDLNTSPLCFSCENKCGDLSYIGDMYWW